MKESPLLRAILSAVAVSLLFLVSGYAVVGLWQMGYCAVLDISPAELESHMDDYSAHASRMATYMNIAMAGTALFSASLYFTLKKRSPLKEMGVRGGRWASFGGAALMGAGLQIPLGKLVSLLPLPEDMVQKHEEILNGSASPVAVQIFYAVIMAPVAEELLFRGIVHKRFAEALPLIPAAILSAAVFGLAHGETVSMIGAVICGVILGVLFTKTGTVITSVIFHIAFNAVGFCAKSTAATEGVTDAAVTALSVAVFALGVVLMIKAKPSPKKE